MPIADLLNKAYSKQRLSPDEHKEVTAWVGRFPDALPIVNTLMAGKGETLPPDQISSLQGMIERGRSADALRSQAKSEMDQYQDEKNNPTKTFLKDVGARLGESTVGAVKGLTSGAAHVIGMIDRGNQMENDPFAVPADHVQAIKGVLQAPAELVAGSNLDDAESAYAQSQSSGMQEARAQATKNATEAYQKSGGGLRGFGSMLKQRALDAVENPALGVSDMAAAVPQVATAVLPGALAGRVATGVGAAANAAEAIGTGVNLVSNAAQMGGTTADKVYSDLMAMKPEEWQAIPAYRARVAAGEDPEAIRQDMAAQLAHEGFTKAAALSFAISMVPGTQISQRLGGRLGTAMAGGSTTLLPVTAGEEEIKTALAQQMAKTTIPQAILAGAAKGVAGGVDMTAQMGGTAYVGGATEQKLNPNADPGLEAASAATSGIVSMVPLMGAMGTGEAASRASAARESLRPAPGPQADLVSRPAALPGPEAPVTGKTAEPVAPLTSPSGTGSRIQQAAMAGKMRRNEAGFSALLQKQPELEGMVKSWRAQNEMGGPNEFLEHLDQVHQQGALASVQDRPEVQQANASAAQATARAEAAQSIAAGTVDPTQAPPAGMSVKDAQAILEKGPQAEQEKAHAAAENARTVAQTAAKDIADQSPAKDLTKTVDQAQKDLVGVFQDTKQAMASGALPFNEDTFREKGVAAGVSPERIETQLTTLREQIRQKQEAKTESGDQGFTPDLGKDSSAKSDSKASLPPLSVIGNDVKAATGAGNSHDYTLAVVPLQSLLTSDKPGYPSEIQPRDTNRYTSQATVQKIGAKLNPSLLMNSPSVTDGAPVVGPDMVVEGGNHRIMGLREAAAKGGMDSYKQELLSRAQEYGLDAAQIQKIKEPVLIRLRKTEVPDRAAFARELNQSMTHGMDTGSRAKADAAGITPEHLDLLTADEPLSSPSNRPFVGRFISTVVPETERGAMLTKNGDSNRDAIERIQDAIFHSAYNDESPSFELVLKSVLEEKSPEGKNVLQALSDAAPVMAKLRALVGKGERADLVIAPELMQAVAAMKAIRDAGMSVSDFLAQQSMFEPMDPLSSRILEDFEGAKRSQKKLATYLTEYAERALASSDPNQFSLLGGDVPTKEELWANATEEVKDVNRKGIPGEFEPGRAEPDLFADQAGHDGNPQADVPPPSSEDRNGSRSEAPDGKAEQAEPAVEPDGFGSSNTIFGKDRLAEKLKLIREKTAAMGRTLGAGIQFDPELMAAGMYVVGYFMEGGVRKFADVAKKAAAEIGSTVSDLRAYLPIWYNNARDFMAAAGADVSEFDDGGTVSREIAKLVNAENTSMEVRVGDHPPLLEAMLARPLPSDNIQLKKMLTEIDGQVPDVLRMKEGQEVLEVVIAKQARGIVRDMAAAGSDRRNTFDALVKLYKSQPNLDIRTSTSLENQAYSTPVPLGFLADKLAGTDLGGMVFEPAAGNGMLLLAGDPSQFVANELDPSRFRNLSSQGIGRVRNGDAMTVFDDKFIQPRSMASVVANPPFGKLAEPKEYDGILFSKLDHLIAAISLRAMKDNGRASLIIAATKDGAPGLEDRKFYSWLGNNYNVVGNFEVDGSLYSRQGASWPVRVLTINGRATEKKSGARLFNAPRFDTWEGVYDHAATILDSQEWGQQRPADREPGNAPDVSIRGSARSTEGGKPAGVPAGRAGELVPAGGREPGGNGLAASGGAGREAPVGNAPVANAGVEPAHAVGGVEGEQSAGAVTGTTRPDGVAVAPDGARSSVGSVAPDLESLVQPYTPKEFGTEMDQGLFVPTGLMEPMLEGLQRIRNSVGDLVPFLAKELQLSEDDIKDGRLMGAQIESIAAAIWNIKENGKGTIIADDTGVGKGRQAASLIRWGILNGKTPVFVTVKPNLFSDMFGDDLQNVSPGLAKPQIVNNGEAIMGKDDEGRTFTAVNNASKKRLQEIVETGKLPEDTNCLFCTYSQLNQNNIQQRAIEALAANSILILDEAHTAAGEDSATGKFFREVISQFHGVVYLSATWAKRASNMVVYNSTGIGDVGMDNDTLLDAITSGGLALQGQVSQALARYGQFFRRERSFEGVEYDTVKMPDIGGKHMEMSDNVTHRLRTILEVDSLFGDYITAMEDSLLEEAGGFDILTGKHTARVTHTDFASIAHNAIRQLGLAMKADETADMAIESIRNGEAVVVGVDNTMGALLDEYTKMNNLKVGDACPGLSWKAVLRRYLDRTRVYKVTKLKSSDATGDELGQVQSVKGRKKKDEETISYTVPVEEMPVHLRNAYNEAYDLIDEMDDSLPASPIDWIRRRIEEAGFRTAEITARSNSIDYTGLIPRIGEVPQSKKARYQTAQDFNKGAIHALVVNVAGATGISLHADQRWTNANNPRRRHMIVAQPALDINMFKQLLGRVHRTGQIIPPRYSVLSLSLPSEIRPIASLQKKVKSLNSSTSASTRGNMDVHGGLDLLNQYGDMVVQQYLAENPTLAHLLHLAAAAESDAKDNGFSYGIASKATGRLALLPVKDQAKFYDEIEPRYHQLIDYLTRTGQNKLLKRKLDLQAKEVRRETIFPGSGNDGPFSSPSHLVTYSIKSQDRLPTPDEIRSEVEMALAGKTPEEKRLEILNQAGDAWEAFSKIATPEALVKASEAKKLTAGSMPAIGETFSIKVMGDEVQGVVTRTRWAGGKGGNPYTPSKWMIRVATNGSCGHLEIPLSQFIADAKSTMLGPDVIFNPATQTSRGSATIITGNLLGAYTQLKGKHGEIVDFITEDGSVVTGMLMPKSFDQKTDLRTNVEIPDGRMAVQALKAIKGTVNPQMSSADGNITVYFSSDNRFRFELADKTRKTVLNATKLLGLEFANGRALATEEEAIKALSAGKFVAEKSALEDAGLMDGHTLMPEAFDDPFKNQLFEKLNEHTVRLASQIINSAGGESNVWYAVSAFNKLREANVKLATQFRRVESITARMQDGTVQPKEMRAFLREMADRMGKTAVDPKFSLARGQAEHILELYRYAKDVGETIAKAAMYKRMEGRRTPFNIDHVDYNIKVKPAVAKLVPFFTDRELKIATEHFVWAFNEQHPERPLDFSKPGEVKRFEEGLTGTVKAHSNKWVGAAAVGMGLLGILGPDIPAMAFHMALAGASAFAAWKLVSFGIDKAVTALKTPKGRFYSMGADWRRLSDNIEQALFSTQEISGPALNALGEIDKSLRKLATAGNGVLKRGLEFFFPSKGTNDKYEALAEMLADRHDKLTPLPPELAHLEEQLKKVLPYFAREMRDAKIPTREDYFPRIYRHEGLQKLKEDPDALAALAEHIVPQILENSPDRVDRWQAMFPQASRRQIAFNLALHALNDIYDGSEQSSFNVAKNRNEDKHDFAIRVATRGGEFNLTIYRKIRDAMESRFRAYTSGRLMKRNVDFDLPKEWQLSNGQKADLVDRNYVRVMRSYINQVSRSIAQRKVFDSDLATRLLNSLGGRDNDQRRDMDKLIKQSLNNYLRPIESESRESVRALYSAWSKINSVAYLGLSVAAPFHNLLFSEFKASTLADLSSWEKAGRVVAMQLFPGLRNLESQKMLREQAEEAGAMLRMVSPGFSGQRNVYEALMALNARTWEAVDVASFFLGRVMAPKILKKAKAGSEYDKNLIHEMFGPDRMSELLSGTSLDLVEDDLNRAGLVYKNLISGYGMTHFRPQFMNSEHGKFWTTFMQFVAEDTKFINDRVLHGPRQNWLRFGRGLAFAGALGLLLNGTLNELTGSNRPDGSNKSPDIFLYQVAQASGGMANFEMLGKAFTRQDPSERVHPFDILREAATLPIKQVSGTIENVVTAEQNALLMGDAEVPLEERPGVLAAPFLRSAAKLPLPRMLGAEVPLTAGEEKIRDYRNEARKAAEDR